MVIFNILHLTKPDKIHTLFEEGIQQKMWPLPVSELFMLGRKTVPKLYNMQIKLKNKYGYNKVTRAGKMNADDILKIKDIKKLH